MKQFFYYAILFLCFSTTAYTTTFDTLHIISVERLNVRSGPGVNFPNIASLKRNDTIEIISSTNKDWAEIKYDNKSAYVSKKYIKEVLIETEQIEPQQESSGFFSILVNAYKKIGKLRHFIIVIILIFILRFSDRLIDIIDSRYINYRSEEGLPPFLIRIINVYMVFFGTIFNTYFHVLLGEKNNRNPALWPVKSMIIISLFLSIPFLFKNELVINYLNGNWFINNGLESFFQNANFWTWYLYILSLLLFFMIAAIIIESIKKTGPYAAIRIPVVLLISLMAGTISLMLLGFIIIILIVLFILSLFGIISLSRFKPDYDAEVLYDDKFSGESEIEIKNKNKTINSIIKKENRYRDQQ